MNFADSFPARQRRKAMCRTIILFAAVSLWTGLAAGQQPTPEAPPDAIELPSVAPPALEPPPLKPERPDTTLLDDTETSGLKARPKDAASAEAPPAQETPLPVGRRCTVLTEQGQSFSGRLEISGVWFVLRPEGRGRKIWVAARYVVAVMEMDEGEPEAEEDVEGEGNAAAQAFRRQVAALERELAATRERLARVMEDAAQSRREAQSQRDLAEQLRQRADEARRVAEKELEKLWEQLKKATQDAPE
jgi:hypothetical protein